MCALGKTKAKRTRIKLERERDRRNFPAVTRSIKCIRERERNEKQEAIRGREKGESNNKKAKELIFILR